jgi:transcriptional regulator with XRE-family HTH domain
MALGSHIRHHRTARGWTLEQLSEKSGVDVGTIGALEIRNSQRSKYAAQLARALGLSLEQLLEQPSGAATSKYASAPIPIKKTLEEPQSPAYGPTWPLRGIAPNDYFELLTDGDREQVNAFVSALLHLRKSSPADKSNAA